MSTYEDFILKLEILHNGVHDATDDPEDTVTVALTQAEMTALCMGANLAAISFPCLWDLYEKVTAKMLELLDAQRPDWAGAEFWGTHDGEEG